MTARHVIAVAAACLAALGALGTSGCSTYRDDLDRAMRHYADNQYEAALALFAVLELDQDSLPSKERAQYFYYRGMTHFRLEQRHDARHWLGLAAASDKQNPGALGPDEKQRTEETLAQLNKERYEFADLGPSTGRPCTAASDCDNGESCEDGTCKAGESAAGADAQPKPETPSPAAAPSPDAEPSSNDAASDS